MRYKIITLVLVCLGLVGNAFCQPVLPTETHIPICCQVTQPDYEHSGLAKWRKYILLIPQHVKLNDIHNIIAIDTASIDSVLEHKDTMVRAYTEITFDTSVNNIIREVQQRIGSKNVYGGFEGAVAIKDSLFFTIETDSLCYIVKGVVKKKKKAWTVVFDKRDTLQLAKPDYKFINAGFESIAYLPKAHKLLAVYENNNFKNTPTAYLANTNLQQTTAVSFTKPMLFRLTDMAYAGTSNGLDSLIAIDHFYNDYKKQDTSKTEFNYYLTGDTTKLYTGRQLKDASDQMHGGNLLKESYTRLVSIVVKDSQPLSWKEEKIMSYSLDNWEGIQPYKQGVLMIVDGKPPGVVCKLSYFSLQ